MKKSINPEARLAGFFKNKTATAAGVEFLRMFILPFLRAYQLPQNRKTLNLDEAIAAWFNIDKRTVIHANAKRAFKMPGEIALAGNKYSRRWDGVGAGARDVAKGQYMLIVIDSKAQTAKVDIELVGKERTFRLQRPEVEFLKDYVTWRQEG